MERAVQGEHRGAAGDQHGAARPGRQQRPDLGEVGGVVEQQQGAGAGQGGAQQRRGGVGVLGQAGRLDAEPAQQGGERGQRAQRGEAGGGAAEVEEQLPVRELGAQRVGAGQREGGLSDPGHAADHGHGGPVGDGGQQGGAQGGELLPAAEEVRGRGRELGRRGASGTGVGGGVGGGRVGEDIPVHLLDGRAGFDAELVDQGAAQPLVHLQGAGPLPGPVEGLHQLAVEAFVQGELAGQGGEFGDQSVRAALAQFGVEAPLQGLQPALPPLFELGGVPGGRFGDVGQRVAAPQL